MTRSKLDSALLAVAVSILFASCGSRTPLESRGSAIDESGTQDASVTPPDAPPPPDSSSVDHGADSSWVDDGADGDDGAETDSQDVRLEDAVSDAVGMRADGGDVSDAGNARDASPADAGDSGKQDAADGADANKSDGADATDAADAGDTSDTKDQGEAGPEPPSCAPGGLGMTNCGPGGSGSESCCTTLGVAGGTFFRTYSSDGGVPSGLSDPATVSTFRLDKYEVTVGRFRQFVHAWSSEADGGSPGYRPPLGSGKHAHLNGALGLAVSNLDAGQSYESGWLASSDAKIVPTNANLACSADATWTPSPGGNENKPINCVNWFESYAFCIWDGGFLPSEAEWEYAAAGGSEHRAYAWGSADPGTNNQFAIFGYGPFSMRGCYYPSAGPCTGAVNIAPVGTPMVGGGRWGQLDLGGNVAEWTMDWYQTPYDNPCTDGVHLGTGYQTFRGSAFQFPAHDLAPAERFGFGAPANHNGVIGIRCARAP